MTQTIMENIQGPRARQAVARACDQLVPALCSIIGQDQRLMAEDK